MDQPQESTLVEGVQAVPDPRKARGKQLAWTFRLGVIASAVLSHHRTPAAIAQGAQQQAAALLTAFRPARGRIPSESTIRRTLRQVDIAAREAQRARGRPPPVAPTSPAPPPPRLHGQAMDGK
jgi:hypothetical protein